MIQRQYLLPNCTLTLEGLSNATSSGGQELRPSLDTLMRFECYFSKLDRKLVGGLDFLESLIRATSESSQSLMSGVQHTPKRKALNSGQVQVQPDDDGQLQLSVPADLLSERVGDGTQPSVDLELTTVQFFDLAEALDQLLADSQTLPNLSPNIVPLSRRQALSGQPLAKRAAPLGLGAVSLAIAASALYFMPVPQISRPKNEPIPTPSPASTSPAGTAPTGTPLPTNQTVPTTQKAPTTSTTEPSPNSSGTNSGASSPAELGGSVEKAPSPEASGSPKPAANPSASPETSNSPAPKTP
ncbi:MAG: DUF4335 domain-containing protein [Thermosynechococcaceae cyanobacterium]